MRRFLILAGLTCLHAAITFGLLLLVFGGGMSRIDTGEPTPWLERVAGVVLDVLTFPLLPAVAQLPRALQPTGFPGEWLIFVANSLLWAVGLLTAWTWARGRLARAAPPPGA